MTAALTTAETPAAFLAADTVGEAALSSGAQRTMHAQELRRDLGECLQGPLELGILQQRLLHILTRRLGLAGLHYHHATLAVDIQLGTQAVHSCGYRLLTSDEYLGEIIFKRDSQFSEQELQLIEAVIPAVVSPLRSSLRSR